MILKNAKIYNNGEISEGILLIDNEIIQYIQFNPDQRTINFLKDKNNDNVEIDCNKRIILPGIIDIHSHLRDMGQKEKETFRTGTKAAIFSGITTIFNMPNTIPPATNLNQVKNWMNKAIDNLYTDVGFIAGIPEGINEKEIKKIIELGVIGFKIYPLKPISGVDWTRPKNIKKLLLISSRFQVPIFIHSDWPSSKQKKEKPINSKLHKKNSLLKIHNDAHPVENEAKFIKYILKYCKKIIKKLKLHKEKYPIIHFCHISCEESIKEINNFNTNNRDYQTIVTFEVTPHHLLLNYDINLKNPSYGKVLPPLRNKASSKYLFDQLDHGAIKFIGTDHAPHTVEEKTLPFFKAPSGFPGFETYPLLMLHKFFKDRLELKSLIQAATINPAKRFNLNRKGLIKENYYADLIIIEKSDLYPIDSQKFRSKAKFSPFENSNFSSRLTSIKIWKVFLRGREITTEIIHPFGKIIRI